mgnify:CR=1 FL=1
MIAKGKSISHGTAALEYDLAKEINGEAAATEIHRHELFGCTGEEMVQEMKPYFVDFPNVKNNCLRFEVSPSVEESAGMTDADWAKLGNDFMQRMGLMNHQYIIVKHSGTEKNRRQAHLHILANRVSPCFILAETECNDIWFVESHDVKAMFIGWLKKIIISFNKLDVFPFG